MRLASPAPEAVSGHLEAHRTLADQADGQMRMPGDIDIERRDIVAGSRENRNVGHAGGSSRLERVGARDRRVRGDAVASIHLVAVHDDDDHVPAKAVEQGDVKHVLGGRGVIPHPRFRPTHFASDVEEHGYMTGVAGQCAGPKEPIASCWSRTSKPMLAVMNARARVWRSPNRLET